MLPFAKGFPPFPRPHVLEDFFRAIFANITEYFIVFFVAGNKSELTKCISFRIGSLKVNLSPNTKKNETSEKLLAMRI